MRRALIVLGSLLAFGALALAILPWWLGVPLTVLGKRNGLTYERYERLGYRRFALTNVRVQRNGVDVRASRVEGETPLRWLWQRRSGGEAPWSVSEWSVEAIPRPASMSTTKSLAISGWSSLRSRLDRIFAPLRTWLPPTTVGPGEVRWPGGRVHLAGASWERDRLRSGEVIFKELHAAAEVVWPAEGAKTVTLRSVPTATSEAWSVVATSPEPSLVQAELAIRQQPARMSARFGASGWLPAEAELKARDWTLPAAAVGLSPAYEAVTGSFELDWRQSALTFLFDAKADPTEGKDAPPLSVQAGGTGDLDSVRIERLAIEGPGLFARLAQPVSVERNGRLRTPDTSFDVKADLAQLPWIEAQGTVDGRVEIVRASNGKAVLKGTLAGEKLQGKAWSFPRARVTAELAWPQLKVSAGELTVAPGETVSFGGEYDLAQRVLEAARVKGEVSQAAVARWLPPGLSFERAAFSAEAQGPFSALVHRGEVSLAKPTYRRVAASSLAATWKGDGTTIDEAVGTLFAGDSKLEFSGDVSPTQAVAKTIRLSRGGVEVLRAAAPTTVTWSPIVSVRGLRLSGSGGELSADYAGGDSGRVDLTVREVSPGLWQDFLNTPGPRWTLHAGRLEGNWARGPLAFSLGGEGSIELEDKRAAHVALAAKGDGGGVELSRLEVAVGEAKIVTVTGKLPVQASVGSQWAVKFEKDADLRLDVVTERDSFFWAKVGELSGLDLVDPQIRVNILGTWRAPRGEATVEIARVGWPKNRGGESLPPLEGVRARLVGDGETIRLESFSASLAGQPVKAEARLPLPKDFTQLESAESIRWVTSHLEARVQLKNADLAAVAPFAKTWIAPTGRLSVDIALKPDLQLEGSLQLRDAVSRPLGPLGVLQSIEADLVLKGRTVDVKRLEAKTGGQPVTVVGSAELVLGEGWRLNLTMKGTNLPLVRQTGFLVRGDVDLRVKTENGGVTLVSGKTTLRDSLFLTDVRTFIPRGTLRNSPSRRPPYFSVEAEPFARWQLGVEVEGKRFLRLRTPVFTGVASARFRLLGTLAEPRAIGEASIEEGQVTLPFATLQVQQGTVSLTELDPYDPRLSFLAVSRRLGYDLKLELSGSASAPNLVFSSSPPLDSEQVLRLVMAGEAPQKEVVYSGQQRAMRLGTYLGQSLAGQIGADTSRAERFSLTVGERVSRDGKETYALEFPLDERWSLMGEYDEFDDYNMGVKWRAFRDRSQDPPEGKTSGKNRSEESPKP